MTHDSQRIPQRRVVMVRHGSVAPRYRNLCYGRSDVELGEDGWRQSREVAQQLSTWPITRLFHSGLARAAALGELIAQATGLPVIVDPRLQEFDFGQWELRTWDEIHAESPHALDRFIQEPGTFSAPGGETVFAMRDRVWAWHQALPAEGLIVAVAHGGPIAMLRAMLAGSPVDQWTGLIPAHGSLCELPPLKEPLANPDSPALTP
jgi:broad specificity phosphatase PhoE